MLHDERDLLETLRAELEFIEKGGYGRSVKTPWKPTSIFQDSLSCLNFGYPYRPHPCNECLLSAFVPADKQAEIIPCHHIPLGEKGETVEMLEREDNQKKMEEHVKNWLRARISELERERAAGSAH